MEYSFTHLSFGVIVSGIVKQLSSLVKNRCLKGFSGWMIHMSE